MLVPLLSVQCIGEHFVAMGLERIVGRAGGGGGACAIPQRLSLIGGQRNIPEGSSDYRFQRVLVRGYRVFRVEIAVDQIVFHR